MGKMKLYDRDSNGFVKDLPNGGMPVYLQDLVQVEQNSQLWGLYAMLKGWSCVLRGANIFNVNIIAQTCSITEGLILLNDVVYYIPPITNQSYPFSFIKGTESPDNRLFEQSGSQEVGIEFDYALKTVFNYDTTINLYYPTNISPTAEIFFSPFTAQRSEFILRNMGLSKLHVEQNVNPSLVVTEDEKGSNIIGGTLPMNYGLNLKWANFNYVKNQRNNTVIGVSSTTNAGTITGTNNYTLSKSNIPAHTHSVGTLSMDYKDRTFFVPQDRGNIGDTDRGGLSSRFSLDSYDVISTNHTHNIIGRVGDASDDSLLSNPIPVTINPQAYNVNVWIWQGYKLLYLYDIPTNTNIQLNYQFWPDNMRYANM